jgi:hypothetical protein
LRNLPFVFSRLSPETQPSPFLFTEANFARLLLDPEAVTMSKRQFKTQASSSRAASGGFGGGFGTSAFGSTSSLLSYVAEPPDLSLISDPHVVVDFKNLSKKDSTTKSKALEDLQKHVSSASHVEDAVLEAWVGFLMSWFNDHVVILSCLDQNISTYIDRHVPESTTTCSLIARPDFGSLWETYRQASADYCWSMALRAVR